MVPVVTVTSYFSNQKQLAHGQFEKEIDHTELSPQRRAAIIARLFGLVTPQAPIEASRSELDRSPRRWPDVVDRPRIPVRRANVRRVARYSP